MAGNSKGVILQEEGLSSPQMTEEERVKLREKLSEELFPLTMQKQWRQVCDIYAKQREAHLTKLTKSEETALHIAIASCHTRTPHDANYIGRMIGFLEKMINLIELQGTRTKVLKMQNVRGDAPLHLAAALGSARVCKLLYSKEGLELRNLNGETPLFVAARHGHVQAFARLHNLYVELPRAALQEPLRRTKDGDTVLPLRRTKDGDTVLHAAISGEYFELAYMIISCYPMLVESVNVDGESPLHTLARKPNVFQSSSHFHFYDSIIYHCVFVDELKVYKCDRKEIEYKDFSERDFPGNYRTCVGMYEVLQNLINIITGNYRTCVGMYEVLQNLINIITVRAGTSADEENQHRMKETRAGKSQPTHEKWGDQANGETTENDSTATDKDGGRNSRFFPANYSTCILLFKFAMKITLIFLGVGIGRIKKIKDKKERHCHALEIMKKMIGVGKDYKYDSNGQRPDKTSISGGIEIPDEPPLLDAIDSPQNTQTEAQTKSENKSVQTKSENKSEEKAAVVLKKETPLLVAAKTGILEMVEKIINTCPVALQDLDAQGRNVVMLAAEYRQTSVFDYLLDQNLPEYMFHQLDIKENSILHLAAKLGEAQPWRIPGAALQMQWEIKWYKYVKGSISSLSHNQPNVDGETPRMVLTKTHKKLMKAGNEWLIKTSESCSVVAALIATVAFATSATVPGGLDQKEGYPIMRDKRAFDVFSIASLVALCLSITALVFFLGIITSRCEERDFKRNLPRKLLMGLTGLFSSIAAMLLSFCAGHTFILRDKLRLAAVPIYAFATIPVAFFAMAQLPLYFDLLWAACRKIPLRSYKVFYQ